MTTLDRITEELADVVPESVKHARAFLVYEGDNPKYFQKAKIACGLIGAYVKAEATKTNRMAVEQASARMKELPA